MSRGDWERMNKPLLKITTHPVSKYKYLSVISKGPKGEDYKTLASFGNAREAQNWRECVDFLLERLREFYEEKSRDYIG